MLKLAMNILFIVAALFLSADNQTPTLTPIFPPGGLPFTVEVEQASFSLPNGLHSFVQAFYKGKWLILAGRVNGMHGFGPDDNNFPPDKQNTGVYVVDPHKKRTWSRDLQEPASGLSQAVIDTLSVTSPQYYQKDKTLYITGGYGVDSATGQFSTKDTLTAIDIPGMIRWVLEKTDHPASKYIRQIHDSAFQVTGGEMAQIGDEPTLLIFGQNFVGFYESGSNGVYTQQVRRFRIHDDGKHLSATIEDAIPEVPDPNYRRRDLNVLPMMEHYKGRTRPLLMAYSGVFTLTTGIWTVPVTIMPDGSNSMESIDDPFAFKQGMNNYVSATLGLYSECEKEMYTLLFGGISYGYFDDGQFETDAEVPFINQITTIKRDRNKRQSQYLMDATFPTIVSTGSNPGNTLLFGAGAGFFPKSKAPLYPNYVVKFDQLKKKKTHIGYIVGGIMSTLPNTNDQSDSAASPYIFKVYVTRK